ncbi:nicalin-1, partial [Tanacetum coccineum]
VLENAAKNDVELRNVLGDTIGNPDQMRLKVEDRIHKKGRDFHKSKTGSVVAFKVTFRDFSPVGSNIWFKLYGPPSDRDVDLIGTDAIRGFNVMPSSFHDIGDVEFQDNWGRVWVDIGTSDYFALDVLLNCLTELSSEYLGIQQYPVYFSFEDEDLDKVLADIKRNDAAGPATATTGGFCSFLNIQGWLPGSKPDGDSNQLPTIAIVASYDTFGAAPALSVGSDRNGSGVVALLEIARLFSILYSNPNTRGRYNILFGLTSGGPYNYNGTQKNCLGSGENGLWLHSSKPPENAYVKQIFEGLSNVAEEVGVTVGLKHKKINISNSRVAWEHEQFSRLRVTAATLSGLLAPPDLLESTGGLFDNREFVNEAAVVKSVKVVAESLARHIYSQQGKNINILADNSSLAVNPSYIRSWLDLISSTFSLKGQCIHHGIKEGISRSRCTGKFAA